MKYSKIIWVLVVAFLFVLSPVSLKAQAQEEDVPEFRLVILNQDWFDLNLRYDYTDALPNLTSADLSDSLFEIGVDEIEAYDWTWQSITLTSDASTSLIESLPLAETDKAGVRDLIELKESLGWGNPIENALYLNAFVVMLDDEVLYGGIFLDPMSQMAINYPVVRAAIVEGTVVLSLLPVHIPFVNYDPITGEANGDDIIADTVADDWSQFSDDMRAAFLAFGTTPEAIEFREIMRDERIHEAMLAADKWVEGSESNLPEVE